jgi:hypothetical protein
MAFVVLAALSSIAIGRSVDEADDGNLLDWRNSQDLLAALSPFIWGALGACLFLLKRLSDIAVRLQFDKRLYRGWWIRVLLGSILGGAVYELFKMQGDVNGVSLTICAFLAGLGVRVVYGAFEKLLDMIAEKLAIRTSTSQAKADARELIAEELKRTNPDAEREKTRSTCSYSAPLYGIVLEGVRHHVTARHNDDNGQCRTL